MTEPITRHRGSERRGRIMSPAGAPHVFERVHGAPSPDGHWVSMLPGFPDGSYGWVRVDARLRDVPIPRLARPA
jgi:hypothetical protein